MAIGIVGVRTLPIRTGQPRQRPVGISAQHAMRGVKEH